MKLKWFPWYSQLYKLWKSKYINITNSKHLQTKLRNTICPWTASTLSLEKQQKDNGISSHQNKTTTREQRQTQPKTIHSNSISDQRQTQDNNYLCTLFHNAKSQKLQNKKIKPKLLKNATKIGRAYIKLTKILKNPSKFFLM